MKTLKSSVLCFAISATFVVTSCKKDLLQHPSSPDVVSSEAGAKISTVNGILKFADGAEFDKTVNFLAKCNQQEANSFEQKYNFVSQRTLFNRVVQAELDYDAAARKMSTEEAAKLRDHSDTYYQYLQSGLIREMEDTYNYSIYSGTYAPVVNEQGLVIIANEIFQLTSKGYKKITNGDVSKIPLLLTTTKTDLSNNIFVEDLKIVSKRAPSGIFDWNGYGKYEQGGKRIEIWMWFSSNLHYSGGQCHVLYDLNVQTREKNWRGQWNLQATWTAINGNWTTYERLISGPTTTYTPSFYYNNLINNFWCSIDCKAGSSTAYQSTYIYTAPSGNNFWYEYEVGSVSFSATGFNSETAYLNHP